MGLSVGSDREDRTHVLMNSGLMIVLACMTGSASLERLTTVPQAETKQATFLNISNARYVVDEATPNGMIAEFKRGYDREVACNQSTGHRGPLPPANYLAISGGGDNGAFGAGLLVGWTEQGTRPSFKAMTGISTGALSAPFAFLGRDYDFALTNVFTKTDADGVFTSSRCWRRSRTIPFRIPRLSTV